VRANREPEHDRDLANDVDGEAIGALGFRRQTDLKTRTAEIGDCSANPSGGAASPPPPALRA
jgi:hypothetical protein